MSITDVRAQLAADDSLVGRALCDAWTAEVDAWLAELVTVAIEGSDPGGVALVAVGGYGRAELSLQSDIDVVLLHRGRSDIGEIADRLWYPIWDARLKLGHAVRTVKEALALAADDLDTATGLLQTRHLAGDRGLTDELAAKAELQWRKRSKRWLTALSARVRDRHAQAGEVAFLLEPDLKEGRGGLRDVHALRWAQAARSILWETDQATIDATYDTLLAVRVELHRRAGRPGDKLLLQEQDGLADALGYPDADALMGAVALAARTIAWTSDDAWHRIDSSLVGPLAPGPATPRPRRRPAAAGRRGPGGRRGRHRRRPRPAPCGPRSAAARRDTQLDRGTLARLAVEAADPPVPWPDDVRAAFVDLLLAGPPALVLLEALDQQGVWERYVPEWPTVRSKPQRNAYHRFTVDRHLWETAVGSAAPGGPGRPARPPGAGRPVPRHRQGRARRPHRQRRGDAGRDRAADGPRRRRHRGAGGAVPAPPAARGRRHPPRPRRPGHDRRGGRRASATARCSACWPPSPRPTRWPPAPPPGATGRRVSCAPS